MWCTLRGLNLTDTTIGPALFVRLSTVPQHYTFHNTFTHTTMPLFHTYINKTPCYSFSMNRIK